MSESKMTPGPWTAVNHSWSHTGIYGADDRQIALINIEPEATEETQAELETVAAANARAIAAVPDLIQCLQQLVDGMVDVEDSDDRVLERSRAVLAKALGK